MSLGRPAPARWPQLGHQVLLVDVAERHRAAVRAGHLVAVAIGFAAGLALDADVDLEPGHQVAGSQRVRVEPADPVFATRAVRA